MRDGRCRSCPAPVFWATTEAKGKPLLVDRAPDPEGNLLILVGDNPSDRIARVLTGNDLARARQAGTRLFTAHFATCPAAAAHRQR